MNANQVKCWFLRRGETSQCRVENQQTQPTYDAESWNRTLATLVGGKCSHHCAIPAPLFNILLVFESGNDYGKINAVGDDGDERDDYSEGSRKFKINY